MKLWGIEDLTKAAGISLGQLFDWIVDNAHELLADCVSKLYFIYLYLTGDEAVNFEVMEQN